VRPAGELLGLSPPAAPREIVLLKAVLVNAYNTYFVDVQGRSAVDIGALGRLAARWPTRRRRRGSAECGQLTRAPLSQAELVAPRSCITMQTLLMPSASNRCTRGAEREQAGALRLEAAPPAHRPRHEAALFVLGALRVRAPGGLPG